ncbi:translocation/assembly module TamB domain-containing protein [Roseateles sp. SL47]|uniref:translocation/assembly module TamB domain-containing protein n=1 Tax=Roseateles sp. SL47 TaxID=2995138 RepID=UPI00226E952E|nr:translocation/assembly module TamB domain-containing protein [Roseateles sp. SL47]WAC75223.1 translocation/assembly module TamB domain-containing protein [Roseateles sp. SL47]
MSEPQDDLNRPPVPVPVPSGPTASGPAPTPSPPPSPAPSLVSRTRRQKAARGLLWTLLVIPALIGLGLLVLTWGLKTERGSAWVLSQVPGLTLQKARGSLLGDFDAERAELVLPGTEDRIVLEQLQWRGLRLAWNRSPLLWGEVQADRLAVARLRVQLAPSPSTGAPQPPAHLVSPIALKISDLAIDELWVTGLTQPLQALRGQAHLGADGGEHHQLALRSLQWQMLTLSGQAQIGTRGDLPLASQWRLSQAQGQLPWTAPFRLDGPLKDLTLQGQLEAARQRLQVAARVQPFAPFPVARLQTDAKDLDLAALLPQAGVPHTGLTGRVQLTPNKDNTLGLAADLSNSAAGRLDQNQVPLQSLALEAVLDPANWTRLRLPRLDARLAGGGRIQATGQTSQREGTAVTLQLDGLDSRQWDPGWPVIQARGSVKLSTRAGLDKAAADEALQVEGRLQGQLGQGPWQAPLDLLLDAEVRRQSLVLNDLQVKSGPATIKATGDLALTEALTLADGWKARLDATVQGLDLRRLQASSAPAGRSRLVSPNASALPQVAKAAKAAQTAQTAQTAQSAQTAQASRSPPQALSGAAPVGGAGAQTLNGRLQASLQSVRGSLWPQGQAQLEVQPSMWQGLPLQGQLRYMRQGTGTPDLNADLRLADASLVARSRIDPALRQGGEQVNLAIDLTAPTLTSLQPLLRSQWPTATVQGALTASTTVQLVRPGTRQAVYSSEGRWDLQGFSLGGVAGLAAVTTRPSATGVNAASGARVVNAASAGASGSTPRTTALARAGASAGANAGGASVGGVGGNAGGNVGGSLAPIQLGNGSGEWAVSSLRDAKLLWTTRLKRLRLAPAQVQLEEATLNLQGSWAQHRLTLDTQGQLPLPPLLTAPANTQVVAKAVAASGVVVSRLQLDAKGAQAQVALQGALDNEPLVAWRQGALWQARDLSLNLQAHQVNDPLLKAGPLAASVRLDPHLQPRQASLAAGRLEILGAGLRWSRMNWQSPTDWDLQADLEPLAAAPALARLQPDFGWGGDLRIDGHFNTRRDARNLFIDFMVSRTSGDLTVTDEVSTQRLGLTDLKLGLQADRGVWHIVQGVAGQNMGAVGGAVTFRTPDPLALPDKDARLEGSVEAQVDNLGNWGPWVPAGWRLGGSLYASLSLGGTLGAPEVRGTAGGQKLSLRNALMGVDMNSGALAMTMSGTQARLESFTAKGGNGQISAEGDLKFGREPSAQLKLTADTFALLQRVDRRVVASGSAQITATAQLLDLKGRFVINEGLFDFSRGDAPQLDSDVQVVRQNAPARAEINGKPLRIKLDVDVEMGRRLQLKGYGIDTRIRGALHLAQDNQPKPTLEGEIRSEGGTFNAYGQKLEVERGVFTFVGPLDNPRLDVLAIRPGLESDDVRVGVTVTGTAANPRIKLYSDPDMSETNKLSWLVLGRSPDNLGRSDTVLMQRAAMALISGDGESASDKLIHQIGLDELSFSGEGDDARGTVVRLGKQISRGVFVAYERGLNATTGNWQLIYKLAQRFTLRAQAGEEQQGLDLIWIWKWE